MMMGLLGTERAGGGGGGTARQAAIYTPGLGLVHLNSGSTVRQTQLPGVAVTEGA